MLKDNQAKLLMKKGLNFIGRVVSRTITKGILNLAVVSALLLSAISSSSQTLGQAVNAPDLTWATSGTGGTFGWSVQAFQTHDGVSAAESGIIVVPSQTSTLQTTVTGPGRVSFWWNDNYQVNLQFTANGVLQTNSNGWGVWRKVIVYFGAGSQTLRWIASNGMSSGRGYLDEVTLELGTFSPEIFVQPLSQSQVVGLDTMFAVAAHGTPPLSYQWQFNESDIVNATNRTVIVSNVQVSVLGDYRVMVTNAVGASTSSVAGLELGRVAAWGQIDSYGWATATNGMTNIVGIAAGAIHNLALREDGTLVGWGYNLLGEISVPADVTNAVGFAAGVNASASLQNDGSVRCWGAAGFGVASVTNVPAGLTNVVQLALGSTHAIALKDEGTVVAWR